jgi:transposase
VLVELRLVEQRYQAISEVLAGVSVTQVALRYGVTRQTVHRWLRRYGCEGLPGLSDASHRPDTCPHRVCNDHRSAALALPYPRGYYQYLE